MKLDLTGDLFLFVSRDRKGAVLRPHSQQRVQPAAYPRRLGVPSAAGGTAGDGLTPAALRADTGVRPRKRVEWVVVTLESTQRWSKSRVVVLRRRLLQ